MHLSYRDQSYTSTQATTTATTNPATQPSNYVLRYRGVAYDRMVASPQPASGSSMKLTYRGQSYMAHQPVAGPHSGAETTPVVLSYRGSLYTRMM